MTNEKKSIEKPNKKGIMAKSNKLGMILGMAGLDGCISIAALSGLFTLENAFANAVIFMAGPIAITTAFLLDGSGKERVLAALLAGVIATIIVVLAAGVGVKALSFLNLNVLKIAGGIAILAIGAMVLGLKMNENIPLAIMIIGGIAAAIWRN